MLSRTAGQLCTTVLLLLNLCPKQSEEPTLRTASLIRTRNRSRHPLMGKGRGVHYQGRECNTAMSVLAYYTLPGVRILHSCKTWAGLHHIRQVTPNHRDVVVTQFFHYCGTGNKFHLSRITDQLRMILLIIIRMKILQRAFKQKFWQALNK